MTKIIITESSIDFSKNVHDDKKLSKLPYIINSYSIYQRKNGIVLGREELSGDRMDGWATHTHYIAVREKDKKIIGIGKVVNGWQGHSMYLHDLRNKDDSFDNAIQWRKAMLEIEKVSA